MQRDFVTSLTLDFCVILGLAFPGTVSAQSTNPTKPKAAESTEAKPGYNWKGLYAGANLGINSGPLQDPVQIVFLPASSVPYKVSSTSFTGGGQVGYN
jgi:hypothetical protein